MDPVSAIGLASGILTFVEAGLKLTKTNTANASSSKSAKAALRLEVAGNGRLTPEQESLSDLAKRCKATSAKLIKTLNEVKPKQISSNPFKSVRHALKANAKAKGIEGLESQLKDYRHQLILALVEFSRAEAVDGFSELISLTKGNEAILKSLTHAIEHLRQSQLSTHDSIPKSLKFDEMRQRFDAVHTAHEDTFKWIYKPTEVIEESDDLSWDTEDKLTKWVGAKKLAFTSFFFWRNGSKAQKSLDGLCRSILHDMLRERPDLIFEAFPGQWRSQAKHASWKFENRQQIPSSVVKGALERLFKNEKLYQQHIFCIFIDGLDEFEPGIQDGMDYIDLVNILRQWTIHANGNLKLCLSSREEGVFMDEYDNDPNFRLQDLTRSDTQNYVRSRLSSLRDENLKLHLATEIPERSSGIFLWTYLVAKTIRNKMTHKATSDMLRQHLNTLPRGLESLFHHILQQLEPGDAKKTLRIINALQTAKSNRLELPLLTITLLDKYDEDQDFSSRDRLILETVPDEEILQAQLRGACGGLIEGHKSSRYDGREVLEFVHRSVPDIFRNDTEHSELARQMEDALHVSPGHIDYLEWIIMNDATALNNSAKRAFVALISGMDYSHRLAQ
ncbi:uncharacterized protein FSUBG_1565 [Fusarium subglutinans]|uniref:Nephrocystin 3-like N-terminal domain-containing protein n=1 Tax=Gibberella subglutinans TaxID=42677 RepID=A0A8H5QE74_GIBSU|nr:uncharacterized protein FSUBG_1565 [Fusarium subglutinans]KAF5612246.1 hypothetical protein FSUBG_1565 [Fusarium subglutinans]